MFKPLKILAVKDYTLKTKEFDERLKFDREKLAFEKQKHKDDVTLKKKTLTKNNSSK